MRKISLDFRHSVRTSCSVSLIVWTVLEPRAEVARETTGKLVLSSPTTLSIDAAHIQPLVSMIHPYAREFDTVGCQLYPTSPCLRMEMKLTFQ